MVLDLEYGQSRNEEKWLPKFLSAASSGYIQLENLVTKDELTNPEEVQDIEIDVKEECERVGGMVKSMVIPRPGPQGEVKLSLLYYVSKNTLCGCTVS